jgi:CDP-4-dehydro-6-deoxyglucose reductase, E1
MEEDKYYNLGADVKDLVKKYHKRLHPKNTRPGEDYIPPAKAKFDEDEIEALVTAAIQMKWVDGELVHKLELELARYLGVRCATMVNSGSSANLLALMALTSPLLGSKALQPGDEIITSACGFPTTVNPIVQAGCIPVFVDTNIPTYNPSAFAISQAITEKTKAVMLAHTLGNPFDAIAVQELCRENNLWLIEDCCDALGSELDGQKVGTFGDISTLSLYPAHHIAVGEGGMVFTNSPMINKIIRSMRDWGRDCWCLPNKDNTCGKRFCQENQGDLPEGYDHKYTYSHVGYNLKSTDLQASIGLQQMKKLPEFIEDRRENWQYLRDGLDSVSNYFTLPIPTDNSTPSWFGFVLTVKKDAPFTRNQIVQYLEENKIGTRNLFAGNLTRQPAYVGKDWRIADELSGVPHSDIVLSSTFWIAVHPSLTKRQLDYMISKIQSYVTQYE